MLVFSHKMVFIKNEAALLCVTSYNLVYNFLMQPFPLKILVFVVHFLNALWHVKETFPKGSSQNENVPLLIVFHLPYSKYKMVKIGFCLCSTRVSLVPLVLHSCCSCLTHVALVLHLCRQYCTGVALVSLVSDTRVINQTRCFLTTLCILSKCD